MSINLIHIHVMQYQTNHFMIENFVISVFNSNVNEQIDY